MNENPIAYCVEKTDISPQQIKKTLQLLLEEECTVPFIARYRKEVTGNLTETQIRAIETAYSEHQELEHRRQYILDALAKMDVLSPELKQSVITAQTLSALEDLYAPYKSKKKTKAMVAKEQGLEPLANDIYLGKKDLDSLQKNFVGNEQVKDFDQALEGAKYIVIERIVNTPGVKDQLRQLYQSEGLLRSSIRKDAQTIKDHLKFKDYFDFNEPIKNLLSPKASHRFLAMNRGKTLKILRLVIELEPDKANSITERIIIPHPHDHRCLSLIKTWIQLCYKVYLHPSLETEFLSELKKIAEDAAISVFDVNLKNLLLAPYLGGKTVMGIDPGIRTGCKVVVVDSTGKLLIDHLIYLSSSEAQLQRAKTELEQLITALKVEYIAIGDGTFGRETLDFIENNVEQVKSKNISATLVSEAGASVYSASEAAIEEFPDKDVTVRGAVSIARRFQDPLSELVKIDPKSIGVGQYQHDVNQSKLKKSLGHVVEDCVNYVGVDLNTASYHILSYISGISATLAKNVVTYRNKNGSFSGRTQLLKVPRFSDKIFEQAAGFLRIYGGKNPLDSTFVHPERFSTIEQWCKKINTNVTQLLNDEKIQKRFEQDQQLMASLGEHSFVDIVNSLKAPSQDPRTIFKSTEFEKNLKSIDDVKVGAWYTGIVNNITNFGAFVNIGIKESGLVHVSQLADRFVENPLDVVKVGQEIKVKVLEIDRERKRLSLSCKKDGSAPPAPKAKAEIAPKNNAFAALKNFKIK